MEGSHYHWQNSTGQNIYYPLFLINFDTSGSSVDINKERDTQLDIWSSFDAMANNIQLIPRLGTLTQIELLALNSMKLEVG